jgi:hypothetical protein
MKRFPEAVASVQLLFDESSRYAEYVTATDRLTETAAVAPCVWRMAYGELDSTETLTASRTGFPGSPPSLGRKLGRRLSGAPLETYVALVEAIYRATALGYVAQFELEAGGETDARELETRSTEDLWAFWAFDFRDMLEKGPFSKTWANQVRTLGSDSLIKDLKDLGLTRLLGGSKLHQLGFIYAQAGVWLRLCQTSYMEQAFFEERVKLARGSHDQSRRFDAYPDEDPEALNGLRPR